MDSISCILFDFDGVLIDSLPAMEKAWNSVQEVFQIKQDFSDYKKYIGLPFIQILKELKINPSLYKDINNHYSKITSKNKKLIKLNPYVIHTLDWLRSNFIKTGIVTSKDIIRTYELVEYFQLNIETIITPELTKYGKPSSEPILYAAKKLKVNINEIIFIGDMKSDMKCAYNSKCLYLHYVNGYQKLDNQMYGGQISSIKEVVEYISNY